MKTMVLAIAGLLLLCAGAFAQTDNYLDGNGTLVDVKTVQNEKWTIRKHIQRVQIGDLAKADNLQIYSRYSGGSAIGQLKLGDFVNISQVAEGVTGDVYDVWLRIASDNNLQGWIQLGTFPFEYAQFQDPYFHSRWAITGYIKASNNWTIRRMYYEHVAVWEVLNIRDRPGLTDTKVISKIVPPENENPQVNLDVAEATEETDTIDGKTDRWLKIAYHGIEGWIFGGYASVERGGYKYYTPENIIIAALGYY